VDHQVGVGILQGLLAKLHLAGKPDIVLVGKEEDLATALTQRLLEGAWDVATGKAAQDPDPRVAEFLQDFQGPVGGRGVGHHQFIVHAQLGEDGSHLVADPSLPVAGGKGHGDLHRSHFLPKS